MTKRNIMTENLREEIAKELGVYEQVKKDGGWENIPSKTCGNMITKAIEIANRNTKQKNKKVQIVKFLSNNLNFFHAFSNLKEEH